MHCQVRTDLFGRVDLDIVSRKKKDFYCSDKMLSNIGTSFKWVRGPLSVRGTNLHTLVNYDKIMKNNYFLSKPF